MFSFEEASYLKEDNCHPFFFEFLILPKTAVFNSGLALFSIDPFPFLSLVPEVGCV
jgi:hypothetical protein